MTQKAAVEKGLADSKGKSAKTVKEQAVKTIEDTVEAAQETMNEVTDQASDELRKMTASGVKFVRENPGAAIAGAVGIGILVGLALRGRD